MNVAHVDHLKTLASIGLGKLESGLLGGPFDVSMDECTHGERCFISGDSAKSQEHKEILREEGPTRLGF